MKRTTWLTLVLALFLVFSVAPIAHAQTDQGRLWYDEVIWVDCANGGNGEEVHLTGYLHVTFRQTFDNAGGVHVKMHANPQGISGVGLTTGDQFRGTGVSQDQFNLKVGEQSTSINNFNIIGKGPGNNALVHSTFHITVNANGTVTAFVDNSHSECR
jgi:hypothetical protein